MKKKIIAVLLSSMMAATSVPAAVMAEDMGEVVSFEAEQSQVTEENTAEETTDEVSEENGIFENAAEDGFTDESGTDGFSDAEETDFTDESEEGFSDTAETEGTELFNDGTTGVLNGTQFDITKTYIVPLTLKNANNLEQDSAAVACPGKFGTLKFDENGTPSISFNLRSVTVGTLTDFAHDFKVFQNGGKTGDTVDAAVVATQNVPKADGSGNHDVPETISFTIPEASRNAGGVYLSMYVDAMGYAPEAYLQIDYAAARESGDASLNYTTEVSTAEVEQFGNYNVTAKVTVTDGRISDVELAGNDFKGTHADDNQMYLSKAINGVGSTKGMKSKLIGLYMNDAQKLNDLDTVSGATYSSNAIKTATMNALGVKIEQEVIPDAPAEKPAAGLYTIDIKDRTAVVDHGLVGESKKATAYLRVDEDGKMWLTYKMVSGTKGEPLYVLGYNGYYPNNDTAQALSQNGVTYKTEQMTAPTIGEQAVVTDITVPLDGVRQTYVNNVYLYVEAMKNLNGETSGVVFDHGKFNIDSTITLYWDTLTNFSEGTDASALARLSDGVYKISGEMVKPNRVEKSMSNEAISHNIKLTVKNGVVYVNMNFNGLTIGELKGYLKDLRYFETGYTLSQTGNPGGTLSPVTVNSKQLWTDGSLFEDDFGTDYPNEISFPLVQEALYGENYIPLQVFVPVMDAISQGTGTQYVFLKLDYSTLTKTTADDPDFAETEVLKKEAAEQTITGLSASYDKTEGDAAFSLGAAANTALTYESSNPAVVTVDANGTVTVVGAGTATITVKAAATDAYKEASATVTVNVAKAPVKEKDSQSVSVTSASVAKTYGDAAFSLGASANTALTYVSSNPAVAAVDGNGTVTITGAGSATITVTAAENDAYKAASTAVTVNVAKADQDITGVAETVSQPFGKFALAAKAEGALTYTSSNTKIATVDAAGNVTARKTGTVKITVSAAENANYKAAASKVVTVKIVKAAPTIKAKTTSKTLKVKKLKKKNQTFSIGASVNSKGRLTYKKTSGSSKITVNKSNGKITVKKGLKKGTYKVKVKVSAAAKGYYTKGSKTVTVTIKVK